MTPRIFGSIATFVVCFLLGSVCLAQNAYIPNAADNTVSVINTATNAVIGSPIPVGSGNPLGVAVTPDRSKVYLTKYNDNTVSVIDTVTNTVIGSPIPVGRVPLGVAVTPDSSKVYVANELDNTVSVIDTATNTVIGPGPRSLSATSPSAWWSLRTAARFMSPTSLTKPCR